MIILYDSSLLDNDKPNLTISFIWQISIKINQKDQNKENVGIFMVDNFILIMFVFSSGQIPTLFSMCTYIYVHKWWSQKFQSELVSWAPLWPLFIANNLYSSLTIEKKQTKNPTAMQQQQQQ